MGREAGGKDVLERVARLEIENAALRARIERARYESTLADTTVTRLRPPPAQCAFTLALAGLFAAMAMGLLSGALERRSRAAVIPVTPVPAVDPVPPTPPVYVATPRDAPHLARVR